MRGTRWKEAAEAERPAQPAWALRIVGSGELGNCTELAGVEGRKDAQKCSDDTLRYWSRVVRALSAPAAG